MPADTGEDGPGKMQVGAGQMPPQAKEHQAASAAEARTFPKGLLGFRPVRQYISAV